MTADAVDVRSEGGELFDLSQARLWAGFVVRSMRRHWFRSLATFLAVMSASTLYALSQEKLYSAESVIAVDDTKLAQGVNPDLQRTIDDTKPNLDAKSVVFATTNIKNLIDQTDLIGHYESGENGLARAKRKVTEAIFGKPTVKDKADELEKLLRTRLAVESKTDDKQILLTILWNNPADAKRIIDNAQKNFLTDRREAEVGQAEQAVKINTVYLEDAAQNAEKLKKLLGNPRDLEGTVADIAELKSAYDLKDAASKALDAAKRQLTAQEKAFEFKYRVVRPAEAPTAPVSGKMKSILLGLIAALLLAAIVAAAADILRGRFVEPWQISKRLDLPVLAEL